MSSMRRNMVMSEEHPAKRFKKQEEISYNYRRLCLKNIDLEITKAQILNQLHLNDFPEVKIYMPKGTTNENSKTKLVFVEFQYPWQAKIALKLINLLKFRRIFADYAKLEKDSSLPSLPPIIESKTLTPNGFHIEDGKCGHCGVEGASQVCKICFSLYSCTFYCDKDHQARDWQRHKYDCKPLPDLILPAEGAEKIMQNREYIIKKKFTIPHVEIFKVGDPVVITHFASHRFLFIRSLKENFEKLEKEIEISSSKAAMMAEKPETDDMVLAPLNGKFRRAQVIDTDASDDDDGNGMGIRCFFVDYGITLKLPWNNLKKLAYKTRALPRQTFKVILANVKDSSSKDVSLYLKNMMEKREKLEVVTAECRGIDRYVVLKVSGRNETINDCINELSGHKDSHLLNEVRTLFDESKYPRIDVGPQKRVKIMDSTLLETGFISCMSHINSVHFWKFQEKINDYGNREAPDEVYEPIINELCLVKSGNIWERGAVIEIGPSGILTLFIDRFVKVVVSKREYRKLPARFATEFFTSLCFVAGLTEENLKNVKGKFKKNSFINVDTVEFDQIKQQTCLNFEFLNSS